MLNSTGRSIEILSKSQGNGLVVKTVHSPMILPDDFDDYDCSALYAGGIYFMVGYPRISLMCFPDHVKLVTFREDIVRSLAKPRSKPKRKAQVIVSSVRPWHMGTCIYIYCIIKYTHTYVYAHCDSFLSMSPVLLIRSCGWVSSLWSGSGI